MSLLDRLKRMKKRWWVIAGIPAALLLTAILYLVVRWTQYRAYSNVSLTAVLPDDAQVAVRVPRLAERWPALSKSPALLALAKAKSPSRGDGPLSLVELGSLAGADVAGIDDARILDAAGRDLAAAAVFIGGQQDAIVATRVPFSYFLAAPFIPWFAPGQVSKAPTGVVTIDDRHYIFCGDILIAGTRRDWVETAAARADAGQHGRPGLELDAVAGDGEPAFWLDVAGARQDPKVGPKMKEWFQSVPVREGLFMFELDAARAVAGRLVVEGKTARLEGTVTLASKLSKRLQAMYAMPEGDAGLAAMLPANTCYAIGAKAEADSSWEFMKELTKPARKGGKRRTISEGFGDFVSSIYLFLYDGLDSAEEHGSDRKFREFFRQDLVIALTAEKEDPFVGLTILARTSNGKATWEEVFNFLMWLYAKEGGNEAFDLVPETDEHDLDIRVLVPRQKVLGEGVRPAFTHIGDVLVMSSSASTLRSIAKVALGGQPGFATTPRFQQLAAAAPPTGPAWSYADVASFRSTLLTLRSAAAKMQVARELEAQGTAKVRAKVEARYRKDWEAKNPGKPWVDAEHVTAIDEAYRRHQADEEARVARDLEQFASRLDRIAGVAFTVGQGQGDLLEWKAVLSAE